MADVVREAHIDRSYLKSCGIIALDPVQEEGVKPKKKKLQASYEDMVKFWKRDKQLIREANVVFDMSPTFKSEGVAHELAYARYFLWKPVVRVYEGQPMPPKASVAFFEDDMLASSLLEACVESRNHWGTWIKRAKWRTKLLARCLWKFMLYQIQEWK